MEISLYLHIPFCRRRCTYCDFNTWAGLESLITPYTIALKKEIRWLAEWCNWQANTVYFGGGTPSLLPADELVSIIKELNLSDGAEVSIEANPGTVQLNDLESLLRGGVNRLSFGMQSANDSELLLLGRIHNHQAVKDSVVWARQAGFMNINLDLMYGLPGQTLENWRHSLHKALKLCPNHLSLYALSLEPETLLEKKVLSGEIPEPDPDTAADMYDYACELLGAEGFEHYEISNWCLPGFACSHNVVYWNNRVYLGLGAGAWGHWLDGKESIRLCNMTHPQEYCNQMDRAIQKSVYPISPANLTYERVDGPTAMAETMFMGMRLLKNGVSRRSFRERFGVDPALYYEKQLGELVKDGLVAVNNETICLTPSAVLISNQVFSTFLPGD